MTGFYQEFKTLGAKKYCYTKYVDLKKAKGKNILKLENDKALILEITVSGVPKEGAKALKNLDEFENDFVFDYEYTSKNTVSYNDDMQDFMLTDYQGKTKKVTDKYGISIVPTTYKLGLSKEYAELIEDESSNHARFME